MTQCAAIDLSPTAVMFFHHFVQFRGVCDMWFAKVNRRERGASKILRRFEPADKAISRRKPHLDRGETGATRQTCKSEFVVIDERRSFISFSESKSGSFASKPPLIFAKEKRRAFGVANNIKLFFIRDGAERRNPARAAPVVARQARWPRKWRCGFQCRNRAETNHDRFRRHHACE